MEIDNDKINQENNNIINYNSKSKIKTKQKFVLVIYTNFNKEENYIDTISPIYFMNYVLEKTNSPVTPYYALLHELENKLPAFEKGIYLENGSNKIMSKREELSSETLKMLADYDNVIYDITTGENYSNDYNFFK